MSYKIKLQLFEGPLDLLLYLVRKDHLNIYDIPIAQVTQQYMDYLELMKILDLNVAGEFLVMAATLIQIKSKMLLPVPEEEQPPQEDDPRAELIKQLLEYERFKEIALELRQKETDQQDIFKRPRTFDRDVPEGPPSAQYFESSIFDLISAFSRALKDTSRDLFYSVIKDEFTVEEKVHDILHDLLIRPAIGLSELFERARDKVEMIVTFLAVLELVKMKEIVCRQQARFGPIEVIRNVNNIIPYDPTSESEDTAGPDQSPAAGTGN
jgi:segregation and condensation protein A